MEQHPELAAVEALFLGLSKEIVDPTLIELRIRAAKALRYAKRRGLAVSDGSNSGKEAEGGRSGRHS